MLYSFRKKFGLFYVLAIFGCSTMHSQTVAKKSNNDLFYEFSMYNIKVKYPESNKSSKFVTHTTGDNSVDFNYQNEENKAKGTYTVIIRDANKIQSKKEFHKVWIPALQEYVTKDRQIENQVFKIIKEKKIKINEKTAYLIIAQHENDIFVASAILFDKFVVMASKFAKDAANEDFVSVFDNKDENTTEKEKSIIGYHAQTFYDFVHSIAELK